MEDTMGRWVKWDDDKLKRLAEMAKEGYLSIHMAHRFGVSVTTIQNKLKKMGLGKYLADAHRNKTGARYWG